MDGKTPAWWMRGNARPQQNRTEPEPAPPPLPRSDCDAHGTDSGGTAFAQGMMHALSQRLAHADGETLLLLGLIWLLREDHADTRLLLALTYILL